MKFKLFACINCELTEINNLINSLVKLSVTDNKLLDIIKYITNKNNELMQIQMNYFKLFKSFK